MKANLISGAAALSLLDVSGALAASPPPFNWTGFYAGANVGYGWGDYSTDRTDVVAPALPLFSTPGTIVFSSLDRSTRPEGAVAGGQFGYNYQAGATVFGFEGDISWTGLDGSSAFSGAKFVNTEDYVYQETLRARLEYFGTARARFGYAFGQFMPYVTGGFAWGHVTTDFNSTLKQLFGGTQTIATSQASTLTGWTIGGGVEYAFAPRWSAKAEYLYIDLGRINFLGAQPPGTVTFRDQIIRVGINFRLSP